MKDSESKRLKELEVRATFQEDTIEKFSKELSIQQKEIILLKEEFERHKIPHHLSVTRNKRRKAQCLHLHYTYFL